MYPTVASLVAPTIVLTNYYDTYDRCFFFSENVPNFMFYATGLAAAACLGRVGVRVSIATGSGRGHRDQHHLPPTGGGATTNGELDVGVGIWKHGLECLDKLGVLERLESEGR